MPLWQQGNSEYSETVIGKKELRAVTELIYQVMLEKNTPFWRMVYLQWQQRIRPSLRGDVCLLEHSINQNIAILENFEKILV